MAGGTPTASVAVGPNETVWRLIEYAWYQPDANGKKVIQEAAFIGQVSLVRASLVTVQIVDAVKNGKFAKFGIARLSVAEIYKATKGNLRIDADKDWPPDAHVLFIRSTGGKTLQLTHSEVFELTILANQVPLLRPPQP
jgi:hypothetical protein